MPAGLNDFADPGWWTGLAAAVVLLAVPFVLPGWALTVLWPASRRWLPGRWGRSLLYSLALMLAPGHWWARGTNSLEALWWVALALGAAAAWKLRRRWRREARRCRPERAAWVLAGVWFLVTAWMLSHWRWDDAMYLSQVRFDYAKHAAVIEAAARQPAWPENPVYHPGEAKPLYYYFLWHAVAGTALAMSGPGLMGLHAAGGGAFWMGLAVVAALRQAIGWAGGRRVAWPVVAILLLANGLDALVVLAGNAVYLALPEGAGGVWHSNAEMWNSPIFSWVSTCLWTPQHAAGFAVGLCGILVFRAAVRRWSWGGRGWPGPALMAGLCWAGMAGASVWVALVVAAALAVWGARTLATGRRAEWIPLAAAGAAACLFAAPFLAGLAAAGEGRSFPVQWQVRLFGLVHALPEPWDAWASLLLAPASLFLETAFLLTAALIAWAEARGRPLNEEDRLRRCLFWTSLGVSWFVASALRENDLGFRGPMLAQAMLAVWARPVVARWWQTGFFLAKPKPAAAAAGRPTWRSLGEASLRLLLIAGLAVVPLDLVLLQFGEPLAYRLGRSPQFVVMRMAFPDPPASEVGRRVRDAVEASLAVRQTVPPGARVLSNPSREYELALPSLGGRPLIGSDQYLGTLFGTPLPDYQTMAEALAPVFASTALPWAAARAIAQEHGASWILIQPEDGRWQAWQPSGWPEPRRQGPGYALFATEPAQPQ